MAFSAAPVPALLEPYYPFWRILSLSAKTLPNSREYGYNPPNAREGWCAMRILRAVAPFVFCITTAFAQDAIPLSLEARSENWAPKSVVYDFKEAIAETAMYGYEGADSGEPSKIMHVGQGDNGQEVTLVVGQVLELALSENRTTGFRWDLKTKAEPACELVESTFNPPGGPPGNGGIHRWQFRAVHPGNGEIELEYRRPWEKDAAPAKVYKLSVRVRGPG
jgi:inhibitor of cysteine peptidase